MITVLICTRNRAAHLQRSLATVITATRHWNDSIEVVVIDNGSRDATASVLTELCRHHSCLRVISDPRPGKSGAINRALRQLNGDIVIFTDDDVHVPASWIADMVRPIQAGTCDAVAGRVILASHLARPWLTSALRVVLAELTEVTGDLPGMVGANMAASLEAALSIGFDESLGPGATGYADDVLFNLRLKAEGWRICGCDGPAAEHHLDPHRLTRAGMLYLAVCNGKSHAIIWHHWLHTEMRLLHIRKWRNWCRVLWYRLTTRTCATEIAEREYELVYSASFMTALIGERRSPPRYAPARSTASLA